MSVNYICYKVLSDLGTGRTVVFKKTSKQLSIKKIFQKTIFKRCVQNTIFTLISVSTFYDDSLFFYNLNVT